MESIPNNIELAFLSTKYHIYELDTDLIIGQNNPVVDVWLDQKKADCGYFITAWNPGAKQQSLRKNKLRNDRLFELLKTYPLLHGVGMGSDASWIPEESFFIALILKSHVKQFMNQFDQLAYVLYTKNGEAEIRYTVKND